MIPSISEVETYKNHKPCTAGVTLLVLLVMCVYLRVVFFQLFLKGAVGMYNLI